MSIRKIAGSVPEKSVGEAMNKLPFSVNSVVIFACGLNGHLATPLSNFVIFKLSILKISTIRIFQMNKTSVDDVKVILKYKTNEMNPFLAYD